MGFLDNLLNREARKIITSVVDSVADNVVDKAKDALNQSGVNDKLLKTAPNPGQPKAQMKTATVNSDEEDCNNKASVVHKRIEKIIAENFSDCELKEKISSEEIGAGYISWKYTYGVYRDGNVVAMINVLDNPNDYKRKIVLQSKEACRDHGIGYVHFLLHLPNRSSYILERLKETIPA